MSEITKAFYDLGLAGTVRESIEKHWKRPDWMCRLGVTCQRPHLTRINGVCTGCGEQDKPTASWSDYSTSEAKP